jgi:hypothetical protein
MQQHRGGQRTAKCAAALGGLGALVAAVAVAPGCSEDQGTGPGEPSIMLVEHLIQPAVRRIDLLLAIDNSRSMADKQAILAQAVPDLVYQLVNPRCILSDGTSVPGDQMPDDPLAACPPGSARAFDPVTDIHIGVVSSSLGDHGGDVCREDQAGTTNNDMGHLLVRDISGGTVATYDNLGFLWWGPSLQVNPPAYSDAALFIADVTKLVQGAGEVGCGLEAQLEGWYRFLVDPDPYLSIEPDAGQAVATGTDTELLQERKDFMRPDSLLAVIMLTDEDDCSIRDGGQYYYAARSNNYHLPRAQIACATNPNDPCCRSCGQPPGDGCPAKGDECATAWDAVGDPVNLRCFDQKRRFGIDFLYPVDRYVTGLTSSMVTDRNGNLVPNPVFSDLDPLDTNDVVRDPGLVFFASIVGVPWQDIARRNSTDDPDLIAGLDANGKPLGGFQSPSELIQNGTWDLIIGDPPSFVSPTDPHMIPAIDPRPGLTAPPAGYYEDPINGHEYTATANRDELQYACIFPLAASRDCSAAAVSCDCKADAAADNPLCQAPDGSYGTTQYSAKAYPGTRSLEVVKLLNTQGIVGSICPAQMANAAQPDYGYRPAIRSIIEQLGQRLERQARGQCLSRSLTPDAAGQVPCLVVEASRPVGDCSCDPATGRGPVAAEHQQAITVAQEDPLYQTEQWSCFCEIGQLAGQPLAACQTDASTDSPWVNGEPVNGWCYIDGEVAPPIGNPALVADCSATERHMLRFVGAGAGAPGSVLFIMCEAG